MFALTSGRYLYFQSPTTAVYGHDPRAKHEGQRSVGSKDRVETDGRTDTTDRITSPADVADGARALSCPFSDDVSYAFNYNDQTYGLCDNSVITLTQLRHDYDYITTTTRP